MRDTIPILLLYSKCTEKEKKLQKCINILSLFAEIIEIVIDRSAEYQELISLDYNNKTAEENFILKIFLE